MTLTRLLETGRGEIWWRLEIAGAPVIWTSRAEDVGPHGDGRTRVHGLRIAGARLGERLDLSAARLDGESVSVEVLDLGGRATQEFSRTPPHRAWIASTITETATTIGVLSTSGWPSSGYLHIGVEAIQYSGITANTFTGCTRGVWGSIATRHYVLGGRRAEATSSPFSYEGRVAILHLRGAPFWRGIVRTEPSYSAGVWRFSVDPLTSILDFELGAELEETHPIGIVYSADAPLVIDLRRDTDPAGTWTRAATIPSSGTYAFFPDQTAFVAEINAQIAAATGTWAQIVRAVERPDGRWILTLIHPSGTVTPVRTRIRLPIHELRYPDTAPGAETQWSRDGPVGSPTTQDAPGTYYHLVDGEEDPLRGVPPRGGMGAASDHVILALSAEPAIGEVLSLHIEALSGRWGAVRARVTDVLAPNVVSARIIGWAERLYWWGPSGRYALGVEREYSPIESGDVGTLLSAIVAQAPIAAPLGQVPLIRPADIVPSAFSAAVSGEPVVRERVYSWRERLSLADVICPELMLAGAVPTIDAIGRITATRLRLAAIGEAGLPEVTLVGSWPQYEGSPHGRWGAVEVRTLRHPHDDDGQTRIVVRDVTALSRSPNARTLQIHLRSYPWRGASPADYATAAARILGLLSIPYRVVTAEAPISAWHSVAVGSAVRVTSPHVPGDGVMGIASASGIVIERALVVDEARVQIGVLLLGEVIGYHVGAEIIGATHEGDNAWTITLDTTTSDIAGPAAHLAPGDRVRVREWDAASPAEIHGTVTSATPPDLVKVQLDSAWTPGTAIWYLRAVRADASPQPSALHRTRYVHVGDSAARIPYTTPVAARRITP